MKKLSKKLSSKSRDSLSESSFVFPKERRYPIHDISHARSALSMVSAHGSPDEKARVRAAVHSRYPEIGMDKQSMRKKLGLKMIRDRLKPYLESWDNVGTEATNYMKHATSKLGGSKALQRLTKNDMGTLRMIFKHFDKLK